MQVESAYLEGLWLTLDAVPDGVTTELGHGCRLGLLRSKLDDAVPDELTHSQQARPERLLLCLLPQQTIR